VYLGTACIDRYIQGWQHWCKSDLKDCGLEGRLPGGNSSNITCNRLRLTLKEKFTVLYERLEEEGIVY
jgi:hypothetical protein